MARTVLTLLFLLGFLLPQPVLAQYSEQAYIVHDVKVDTLAESAVKARDKAFGEAQKAAFLKLAGRYYTPEELLALPLPTPQAIAGMVQDFEVVSEQLSTKRYVGTYTFRFKANAVNRYFGGRAPQYVDQTVAPISHGSILLLPFFQQGSTVALWDAKRNPWLGAWQQADLSGNPSIMLPLGDVSDMMDIKDGQALTYNPAALKRMLARYEVRDAVIAVAKFDQMAKDPLVIDIYRTDRKPPELYKSLSIPLGNAKVLGDLLKVGIDQTRDALTGNWKLATIVQDGSMTPNPAVPQTTSPVAQPVVPRAVTPAASPLSGQVRATAKFSNIAEWLAIRRSLNAVPGTTVRIVALKSNEAVVDLGYSSWASLSTGLGQAGLTLAATGPNAYRLSKVR